MILNQLKLHPLVRSAKSMEIPLGLVFVQLIPIGSFSPRTSVWVPCKSRVQAPVDVFLDDLTLSLRTLDVRPTDALDSFLAVEFALKIPCEDEILPQVLKTAFECPLEHFGLRKAAGLRDFSYPVGNFGGHTE